MTYAAPPTSSIIEISTLTNWLRLQTEAGKAALATRLTEWTTAPASLERTRQQANHLQKVLQTDPTLYPELRSHFTAIAAIEKEVTPLLTAPSDLERETYGELLFLRPLLQPLNSIPFLLPFWSLLRIYLLPGLSLLLPLLTLLAPYFILKYVLCVPITFTNYITLLHSLLSGQLMDPATCSPSASSSPSGLAHPTSLLKQLAIILVTVIQGIVQPYWTYRHLSSVGSNMDGLGRHLMEFRTRYEILQARLSPLGLPLRPCPLPALRSLPHAVSEALLHPNYFRLALKYLGTLEVHLQLLQHPSVHPVKWVSSPTPQFHLQDTYDIHIPPATPATPVPVPFTVTLGGSNAPRHALLTGPNKGGKSTILRSVALSALLAHTYGCAIGHLTATPFHSLYVCLKPDDLPGTKSRFEREIEFTAQTLRPHSGPVLVLLDELYHSTNPPDALSSCIHYSNRLWKSPSAVSVISTHLFEWVEQSDPAIVQRLCCPAYYDESGTLQFTYKLHPGICRVSSVDLLLRQNGLLPSPPFVTPSG